MPKEHKLSQKCKSPEESSWRKAIPWTAWATARIQKVLIFFSILNESTKERPLEEQKPFGFDAISRWVTSAVGAFSGGCPQPWVPRQRMPSEVVSGYNFHNHLTSFPCTQYGQFLCFGWDLHVRHLHLFTSFVAQHYRNRWVRLSSISGVVALGF